MQDKAVPAHFKVTDFVYGVYYAFGHVLGTLPDDRTIIEVENVR